MTDFRCPTRRALLGGSAMVLATAAHPALAGNGPDDGVEKKRKKKASTAAEATAGTLLPIPRLVDVGPAGTFDLVAAPARHAFLKDKPVDVVGYGGTYLGPALRLRRGATARIRLVNRLDRPTNVHWHGLLVEGRFDGGTHPGVAPGETWEATLAVDQPAATLWYHAHVHGSTTRDVHDGLAGLLIVEDETSPGLGLPSTWGVDDIPLVLQDRDFDAAGRPVMPPLGESLDHGFRGRTPIVNGIAGAIARVPPRLVRLRLLNGSGARTWRLCFDDRRTFQLIATDGGLLPAPVDLAGLPLAPGERAEILVDFAAGTSALMSEPDAHEHRDGHSIAVLPDVVEAPLKILAFETTSDRQPSAKPPARLAPLASLPSAKAGLPRRRFELRVTPALAASGNGGHAHAAAAVDPHAAHMSHGAAMPSTPAPAQGRGDAAAPPSLTINGRSFEPGRIDERATLGTTEIWEIVCPEMAHPFHLHGAQFRVLSEDGGRPRAWTGGLKDTILVENSAELVVTFTRRADEAAPFVYHCHLLEHEDGGMMGTLTVG